MLNKITHIGRELSISIMLLVAVACSEYVNAENTGDSLTIRTSGGKEVNYQVEIADTDITRQRGLMYRMEMPTNNGMLLDFGSAQKISIWMKNTFIPLDIIYIGADGMIAKIVPDAVPHSTTLMNSDSKVRAVLEVNAGQAAYHDIKPGDRVLYHVFK